MERAYFEGDYWENQRRKQEGKLPIVYNGTNKRWLEESGSSNSEVYFTDSLEQARVFAKINSVAFSSVPAIRRVDLEELRKKGLKIKIRDNEFVVQGEIPDENITIIYIKDSLSKECGESFTETF